MVVGTLQRIVVKTQVTRKRHTQKYRHYRPEMTT